MRNRYIITQEIVTDDSGLVSIKVIDIKEVFTQEEDDEDAG